MANEPGDDKSATAMTLRSAALSPDGQLADEQVVDEMICECCQTDVALTDAGPVVVYRDRSIDEMRDIGVSRFVDGRWQKGRLVSVDDWQIDGCPVNGPAIDADGDATAVAWFTASRDFLGSER